MLDIKYVAGLIDGEGCISLTIIHGKNLYPHLKVKMTHRGIIETLHQQFGGSFTIERPLGNRQEAYSWQTSGQTTMKVIKQVQPYLIVKQPQAKLVTMFDKLGVNDDQTVNNTFKTLMHKYNQRGSK